MTTYTHHTAPTQFVEANGTRFAYRRFGESGSVPLVFNMHFTGTETVNHLKRQSTWTLRWYSSRAR